jgi:hypothetical protein
VLKQTARCRNKDVHAAEPLSLFRERLATDHEPSGEEVVSADPPENVENLYSLPEII